MGQGKWHCLLSDFLSQNAKLAVRENSTFSILETEVTEDFFPTPISKVGKGSKLVKIVAAKIPVTLTLNLDFTYIPTLNVPSLIRTSTVRQIRSVYL